MQSANRLPNKLTDFLIYNRENGNNSAKVTAIELANNWEIPYILKSTKVLAVWLWIRERTVQLRIMKKNSKYSFLAFCLTLQIQGGWASHIVLAWGLPLHKASLGHMPTALEQTIDTLTNLWATKQCLLITKQFLLVINKEHKLLISCITTNSGIGSTKALQKYLSTHFTL